MFFSSKYILDFYNSKVKVNYACPLGEDKFNVDELKYNENNLKMLEFIDTSREILDGESTKKIAEDDEYEYYVKS